MISFSVITCTYNAAAELPRTLKSVAEQTYPHVEHLLVDGLSADNTRQLIDQYVADMAQTESLHTIKVKAETDAGLYDAMNKGIEMATGTYLVFINAGAACRALWRHRYCGCRRPFSSPSPHCSAPRPVVAVVQSRHVGVPSGLLRPHFAGQTNALQPGISFFGRRRLVHPRDEGGQSIWLAHEKRASRCGQLP